jgi:coniferyl-aldehyde dehydrogenase
MSKLADLVEQHIEELAQLDGADAGKLLLLGKIIDIPHAVQMLRYYAGAADKIHGETLRVSGKYQGHTLKEPVGVVGVIIPWNFPSLMFFLKISPALAAGCTVVVKPAEQTPLSALFYANLAKEAGIPEGVINVVPGFGPTAGAAIASHMDIDSVSSTFGLQFGQNFHSQHVPYCHVSCGLVVLDIVPHDKYILPYVSGCLHWLWRSRPPRHGGICTEQPEDGLT